MAIPIVRKVRIRVAILLSISILAACGGDPGVHGDPTRIPLADPPQRSGLVWMIDARGEHETLWVSTDGAPLASQPIDGPVWAEGDTLWQWVEEPVAVPVFDGLADSVEPHPSLASGTRPVTRAVLRELAGDLRVVAIEAPAPGPVRELVHEVRLVGSVGPYVFAVERLTVDAFGAHGVSEARALVWDLRAAAPAQILTDRERSSLIGAEIEEARRALLAEGADVGVDASLAPDEIELVAMWPRWEMDGGLALELQLATEVCYACSDGEWSDYTRSVRVPTETVYERLAEHAALPDWVREAAALRPGGRVLGFTDVTEPAPARILDTLRRAPDEG